MIGLVYLVWGPLGLAPLRRFLDSYRRIDAGAEHELVLLLNGVDDELSGQLGAELDGVAHRLLALPAPVQDLAAYAQAATLLEHEHLCFVNSHAVVMAPSWLALLAAALERPQAGIVGASGSWGSIRSYLRFSLGLGGPYSQVFEDRRATIATLEAITARQDRETPRSYEQRRIPILTYGLAVMDQAHGFSAFPAHHIRTTGFMLRRELLGELRIGAPRSKNDAYRLESGRRSLTAQIKSKGLDALVVGRDGRAYGPDEWFASRTFWRGDQENLLIADKQTGAFANGSPIERSVLSRYAWGERAGLGG
jgi:hypothetical protein